VRGRGGPYGVSARVAGCALRSAEGSLASQALSSRQASHGFRAAVAAGERASMGVSRWQAAHTAFLHRSAHRHRTDDARVQVGSRSAQQLVSDYSLSPQTKSWHAQRRHLLLRHLPGELDGEVARPGVQGMPLHLPCPLCLTPQKNTEQMQLWLHGLQAFIELRRDAQLPLRAGKVWLAVLMKLPKVSQLSAGLACLCARWKPNESLAHALASGASVLGPSWLKADRPGGCLRPAVSAEARRGGVYAHGSEGACPCGSSAG
jgi:hypothetical protein